MLHRMVDQVKKSGANVVFCQKGIDDLAQHYLAKEGIYAVRRVKKSDMEKLAKATGAPTSSPRSASSPRRTWAPRAWSRSARSATTR
jgi:archaeal chaperonin